MPLKDMDCYVFKQRTLLPKKNNKLSSPFFYLFVLIGWFFLIFSENTQNNECYYLLFVAVIFVIDSSNKDRLMEAQNELAKLVQEKELREASLLIFVNKQVFIMYNQEIYLGSTKVHVVVLNAEIQKRNRECGLAIINIIFLLFT